MRFDDTLETVLAADLTTPYGRQSAWRQLVDLLGRRRAPAGTRAMATLRSIRTDVPVPVRVASARALEHANPPAPLVRLFAMDDLAIAVPVLRSARLTSAEWIELLPDLAPGARHVLRNRRDLSPVVKRALESFGPADFVLGDESIGAEAASGAESLQTCVEAAPGMPPQPSGEVSADFPPEPAPIYWRSIVPAEVQAARPSMDVPAAEAPRSGASVPLGENAPAAGVGEEDLSLASSAEDLAPGGEVSDVIAPHRANDDPGRSGEGEGTFEIADVVARIDAFWRDRETAGSAPRPPVIADAFRFETDAQGVLRWVDGASRSPLVGLSLDFRGARDGSRVDGVAAGAFRSRSSFSTARLWIEGESDAAGDWLISAIPVFDSANGRFTGYRGTARRPRVDERAEPARMPSDSSQADSLRQLVHELRTPTNAIAGFAEMIETQMLGPVADPYRERAQVIRIQAKELLGAIDDLDLAARIDSAALALVAGRVALRPVLTDIGNDLAQLSGLRGSMIALPIDDLAVMGDRRAVERLLARLMATLVSASGPGERIGVHMAREGGNMVAIAIDRPKALADYPGDSVLGIDDEREDATLLGTGFALRLARNLARELSGSLVIEPESLTLRLPAADTAQVGMAHLS